MKPSRFRKDPETTAARHIDSELFPCRLHFLNGAFLKAPSAVDQFVSRTVLQDFRIRIIILILDDFLLDFETPDQTLHERTASDSFQARRKKHPADHTAAESVVANGNERFRKTYVSQNQRIAEINHPGLH